MGATSTIELMPRRPAGTEAERRLTSLRGGVPTKFKYLRPGNPGSAQGYEGSPELQEGAQARLSNPRVAIRMASATTDFLATW